MESHEKLTSITIGREILTSATKRCQNYKIKVLLVQIGSTVLTYK